MSDLRDKLATAIHDATCGCGAFDPADEECRKYVCYADKVMPVVAQALADQLTRFAETLEQHVNERLRLEREAIAKAIEAAGMQLGPHDSEHQDGMMLAAQVARDFGKDGAS